MNDTYVGLKHIEVIKLPSSSKIYPYSTTFVLQKTSKGFTDDYYSHD